MGFVRAASSTSSRNLRHVSRGQTSPPRCLPPQTDQNVTDTLRRLCRLYVWLVLEWNRRFSGSSVKQRSLAPGWEAGTDKGGGRCPAPGASPWLRFHSGGGEPMMRSWTAIIVVFFPLLTKVVFAILLTNGYINQVIYVYIFIKTVTILKSEFI